MRENLPLGIIEAHKIYNILVAYADAPEDFRDNFVYVQTTEYCHEFRFCGSLGFGGKFRRSYDKLYIDCYPEDETPECKTTINKVNALLQNLHLGKSKND